MTRTPRTTAVATSSRSRGTARTRALAAALAGAALLAVTACAETGTSGAAASSGDGAIDRLNIVVPADAGGGWDQTGRALSAVLEDEGLVGSAGVTNVGGAGGTVGLASLANEKDPNTLMVTGLVMVGAIETNAATVRLEDTVPIAKLTEEPLVIVVPADSEYQTVADLVDDVVANGPAVSITGGSAGGADHILAATLLREGGVPAAEVATDLNYIAYSGGGESLAALLGGQVDAGISGVGEYAEQVEAGTVRALAVSGAERSDRLPDAPTLTEEGYDVVLTNWRGVVAPGSVDEAQTQALVDLVTELHGTEGWTAELTENNWDDAFLPGAEFQTDLTANISSVQQTLRDIGLVS